MAAAALPTDEEWEAVDAEQERLLVCVCGPCDAAGQLWTCHRVLVGDPDVWCDGPEPT